MKIIDTVKEALTAFANGRFDLEKWEKYIDAAVPGAKEPCLSDMRECVGAGFSFEKNFLPVLNAVWSDRAKRAEAIDSFHAVADTLDEKITARFGRTVDVDLILYLGLCNGAGWVTPVGGRTVVLFGIEKIMELGWQGRDAMTALILHELGHVYQDEYGVLEREFDDAPDGFLWQLFTEGVAMVFEQEVMNDPDYFHQYDDNWKDWCGAHLAQICASFCADLPGMTYENQRYFGDWARYEGKGDVGYYLGARFVRFLLQNDGFDRLICYDAEQVKDGFAAFKASLS